MHRDNPISEQLRHTAIAKLLSASLMVVSIGLPGCASYQSGLKDADNGMITSDSKRPVKSWSGQHVVIPVPEKMPTVKAYQHEIVRLKQLLAEKDKLIQHQTTKELKPAQVQGKVLLEPASGISQTKNQQHRLATKPEVASKIAEAEVLLNVLKQSAAAKRNPALLSLAQASLDAALLAYERTDFSNGMSYAAQSREYTEMITRLADNSYEQQASTVTLHIPLLLQTRQKEALKATPGSNAETLGTLAQNTPVNATAYHGHWLHVETRDGRSGWIRNQSVNARINLPNIPDQES